MPNCPATPSARAPRLTRAMCLAASRLHEAYPPIATNRRAIASNVAVLIDLLNQIDGDCDFEQTDPECHEICDGNIRGGDFGPGDVEDAESGGDREASLGWTLEGAVGDHSDTDLEHDPSKLGRSRDEGDLHSDCTGNSDPKPCVVGFHASASAAALPDYPMVIA